MIAVLSVEVLPPDTPISLNPTIEFGGKFGILKISRVPLVILLVFKLEMRAGDNSPLVILLALMFGINVKLNAPLLMSILSLAKEWIDHIRVNPPAASSSLYPCPVDLGQRPEPGPSMP